MLAAPSAPPVQRGSSWRVRIVNLCKKTHHGNLSNLHQDTIMQIVF